MKINDILLESFADATRIFSQDADDDSVKKYLDTFKDLSKRNIVKGSEKDIGKWIKQGWKEFKTFVDSKKEITTNTQSKKSKKKESIVVHNDENKMVVIPLSKAASCFYGKNTKWCTAATQSENLFNDYFFDKNKILFYVLFKDGREKYAAAYHLSRNYIHYFNAHDEVISYETFFDSTGINSDQLTKWVSDNKNIVDERKTQYKEILGNEVLSSEDPKEVYEYVNEILQKPFPEGEYIIAKSAYYSYMYAINILNGRFPKGEYIISRSITYSIGYAMDVLEEPFPKGEYNITFKANMADFIDYTDFLKNNGFEDRAKELMSKRYPRKDV